MPPSHIAILDLEWTSWEGAHARNYSYPGEHREIVQFGVLKLIDDEDLPVIDSMELFVQPRLNPILSDYFSELTGITQAIVDEKGMPFMAALQQLRHFLGDDTESVCSYGRDGAIVRLNCNYNDIPWPFHNDLFRDVCGLICEYLGVPEHSYYSGELWKAFGFSCPGAAHDALTDCHNVAEALRILRRAGRF